MLNLEKLKGRIFMNIEFLEMIATAKSRERRKMTVACPHQSAVISAAIKAHREGLVEPIFIGDKEKINRIAEEDNMDLSDFRVIHIEDDQTSCDLAIEMTAKGEADFAMKGLIDTSVILKSYLKPEYEMRGEALISHVAVFNPQNYGKMIFVTDASMNITPNLDQKRQIIDNSVKFARTLGVIKPKVAVLAAIEKVNPKMIETVEAYELQKMNERGIIKNSIVCGPLALDNAISVDAARIKSIDNPVAGYADILMVPNIEIGNILYKALAFSFPGGHAGVIVGGKRPIVLTSRSDGESAKFNSIALAKYLMDQEEISIVDTVIQTA